MKEKEKKITGAQCYYGKFGFKSDLDKLMLAAGALCFKRNNPEIRLHFYGDEMNGRFVRKLNDVVPLYDLIDDTTIDQFEKKTNNSGKYFNSAKFAVLEDCISKDSGVILFDTDLIPNICFTDLLKNNDICCTHFESLEPTEYYPGFETLLERNNYLLPAYEYYRGFAYNTSILAIKAPEIASGYIQEAEKFMACNSDPANPECLYVEQVILPVLAETQGLKTVPIVKALFSPQNGKFSGKGWGYDKVESLYDSGIMHLWIRKKNLLDSEYEELVSDLFFFIKRHFSEHYSPIKHFISENSCVS